MCTSWDTIARKTGIARVRIETLNDGTVLTSEEIEKRAALWSATPEGLRRSIEESGVAAKADATGD
ncbi:hypothetical protein E5675_16260 [Sphingopyxis sp. PAMC25046]|uniref:hypothetical protein n=1 Tax=Sphingopyxis sp. PAMC25046 TaxID=2565556 RepID=UPI00109DD4E3|nr:hypothetical protein [Sphingopyxis sp. PAMC25046]QCB55831.1 hypothetical protein E5675_16260 [Sphingopyxis sp. PAMC25046]